MIVARCNMALLTSSVPLSMTGALKLIRSDTIFRLLFS